MSVESKPARVAALFSWWAAAALGWFLVRPLVGPSGPWLLLLAKGAIWLGSGVILGRLLCAEPQAAVFALGAPDRRGLPRAVAVVAAYLGAVAVLGLALGQPLAPTRPSATAVATTVVNAIVEEAAFRGLLVLQLARHMRFATANLLGALAFLAVHLPSFLAAGDPATVAIMSLILLVFALALGEATRATRSIWVAVVAHTVNNLLAQ